MRYRDYKNFRPDNYYHIYNRGNNKQDIFLEPADYFQFIKRIKIILQQDINQTRLTQSSIKPLPKNSFVIIAYCLMQNHFHFLIRQNSNIGINRLISKLCTSYAIYFNKKYGRVGRVFQDKFKAKHIDDERYLLHLTAYIHNNPNSPLNYKFSSFNEYIGVINNKITDSQTILSYFSGDVDAYKKFVLDNKKSDIDIKSLIFEEN